MMGNVFSSVIAVPNNDFSSAVYINDNERLIHKISLEGFYLLNNFFGQLEDFPKTTNISSLYNQGDTMINNLLKEVVYREKSEFFINPLIPIGFSVSTVQNDIENKECSSDNLEKSFYALNVSFHEDYIKAFEGDDVLLENFWFLLYQLAKKQIEKIISEQIEDIISMDTIYGMEEKDYLEYLETFVYNHIFSNCSEKEIEEKTKLWTSFISQQL